MNISRDYGQALEHLDAWHELVAWGQQVRADRDRSTLELGELALRICPQQPQGGRTKPGEKSLAQFAREVGCNPSTLSRARQVCLFWRDDDLPDDATWWQLSEAMRRAGYRAGAEITSAMKRHALDNLFRALDDAPERSQTPPDALVERARKALERVCEHDGAAAGVKRRCRKALDCLLT